jgi:hypothetical protein
MLWAGRDLREQLGVPDVADSVTATETEDERCRPVLHLSDGRTARTNPRWPYEADAVRWVIEPPRSAQTYQGDRALTNMRAGLCPECGELAEQHSGPFQLRPGARCSLLPHGVTERINWQRELDRRTP